MKVLILISVLIISVCSKDSIKFNFHNKAISLNDIQDFRNLDGSSLQSCLLIENYAVKVDFDQTYGTNINSSNDSEIFLAISLWSSESGFPIPDKGLTVQGYICDIFDCIEDNSSSTIEFTSPWTRTTTRRVHLNKTIEIAHGAWQLKTSALSFNFYEFSRISNVPYGWIGLGTESEAKYNFQNENNPMFSLLINKTKGGLGSLIFGFDSRLADIDRPIMAVNSDANWKMQMISLSFGSIIHYDDSETVPIMFDLLITGIVLPKRMLVSLRDQMRTYDIICVVSFECQANNLTGLPPLIFGLADGNNISLSPNDYMKKIENPFDLEHYLFLSLWIRTSDQFRSFYGGDHIILGWDVLANFYTLFQQTNGVNTISFYEINSAKSPNLSTTNLDLSLTWVLTGIFFIIGLLFVGVVIVLFFVKKNRMKTETETTELSKFEHSAVSVDPQEQNHLL